LHHCNDKQVYVFCSFCGAFRLGSNNPAWNGGASFEPYPIEFNEQLKNKIRQRDGFICQLCNKDQSNLIGFHKKPPIHHIDYDKSNCQNENLITLCSSCNTKVNSSRQKWQIFFTKGLCELNAN
jgi:hypothetical protein